MSRYLCHLCFKIVQYGETHSCFFYKNDDTCYTLPQVDEKAVVINHGEITGEHANNSNDYNAAMCEGGQQIRNSSQASSTRADSVLSVGIDAPNEESFEPERDFTDLPVPPEACFHAPSGHTNMDVGVNQPLSSKEDADALPGPSTIRPPSIGRDGKGQYVCHLCSKRFEYKSLFVIHHRRHTGEKPFICDICGRGFTDREKRKRHARIHTGEKPYACTICGREFARKDMLGLHMRTHTGERPYSCDICNINFTQRSSYRRHVRDQHGGNLFKCGECGQTFSSNEHRNRHYREKH